MHAHDDIRIGTLVPAHDRTPELIRAVAAARVRDVPDQFRPERRRRSIPSPSPTGATGARCPVVPAGDLPPRVSSDRRLRQSAHEPGNGPRLGAAHRCRGCSFGCDIVSGFAGRIPGRPVPESYGRFGEVFRPLARRAEDRGVRLAFENCEKRGTWESGRLEHRPCPAGLGCDVRRGGKPGDRPRVGALPPDRELRRSAAATPPLRPPHLAHPRQGRDRSCGTWSASTAFAAECNTSTTARRASATRTGPT
jgi:hypothetical protein